jgi:carbamoyltransferase
MSVVIGLAGATRNAAVAVCDGGRVIGMCEHERVTRTRGEGLPPGKLPEQTIETLLRRSEYHDSAISTYAVAEASIAVPAGLRVERIDHHLAHAATAFYTSPFTEATVLVCDSSGDPELTVWRGDHRGLRQTDFAWRGPAFARLYSLASQAMGLGTDGEARLEALARIGGREYFPDVPALRFLGDALDISVQFQAAIHDIDSSDGAHTSGARRAHLAAQLQRQIGDVLLEVVTSISRHVGGSHLCLGGGLFYNSFFNTLVARSGLYADTYVPANPGNAGVAIGAALLVSAGPRSGESGRALTPFLGPSFTSAEIKATLDNCKLSYDYVSNGRLIDQVTAALTKGELVGWFQGRMEWGVRALGNRSILASPLAPYVLENLNRFLKHREVHRTYSVSICADDLPRFFCGPTASPLMEYEYQVLDRDLLRDLLPEHASRLRVQTVDPSAGVFYELLRAFGNRTGVPMLVNTSFNGFNEPIVCHPRDAVRVFYGTGLDMAVLDGLVLRK